MHIFLNLSTQFNIFIHTSFSWTAWSWKWRQCHLSKCQELHIQWNSFTNQKAWIFSNTTVRPSCHTSLSGLPFWKSTMSWRHNAILFQLYYSCLALHPPLQAVTHYVPYNDTSNLTYAPYLLLQMVHFSDLLAVDLELHQEVPQVPLYREQDEKIDSHE